MITQEGGGGAKICITNDFMAHQQHGLSDSTPRAGSDRLQKSAKSWLSALK